MVPAAAAVTAAEDTATAEEVGTGVAVVSAAVVVAVLAGACSVGTAGDATEAELGAGVAAGRRPAAEDAATISLSVKNSQIMSRKD